MNETFKNKFRNSETAAHCVIRHNYELIDFQKRCLDDQGNLDDLVDIVAGKTHFVVLTSKSVLSINFEPSINQLTGDIVLFIFIYVPIFQLISSIEFVFLFCWK